MSPTAPSTPAPVADPHTSLFSPEKVRPLPSPFELWAVKTLDPVVGVPLSSFNFPPNGPPKGSRVLLLGIVTSGKSGEGASAQGLDLRQREGALALLKGVFQLSPTTLIRSSNRYWLLELPEDYEYEKLRGGVFSLSQTVGFVLLWPDASTLRTVEGYIPNFWTTDLTTIRTMVESEEIVDYIVELEKEVDEHNVGTGNVRLAIHLKKKCPENPPIARHDLLNRKFAMAFQAEPAWIFTSYPPCGACGFQDHFRVSCPWVPKLIKAPTFDLKKLGSLPKKKMAKADKKEKPAPSPPPAKAESSRQGKSKRKLDEVIPEAVPETPLKKRVKEDKGKRPARPSKK